MSDTAGWIPVHYTTEKGMIPKDQTHREFTAAMTVKTNVDAAIKLALTGDGAEAALDRLVRATNALRGVRSPRIHRSWVRAIGNVHSAIVDAYGLAPVPTGEAALAV